MYIRSIVYGLAIGLVVITINTLNLTLGMGAVWLGLLVMFIAFSTLFLMLNQYLNTTFRNTSKDTLENTLTFTVGLQLTLTATLVASLVYVLVWEMYLYSTDYTFIDTYIAGTIQAEIESGAGAVEITQITAKGDQTRQQYNNPAIRLPMTFIEIFPMGLLMSIAAAFIFRRKTEIDHNA